MIIICVTSGSISNDWLFSSFWIVFSCHFACLGVFDWMPGIVIFTLLGAGYFLFSYKIFLNYVLGYKLTFKQFDHFGSCFYDLLGNSRAMLGLGLIILYYWDKTILSTLSSVLKMKFFQTGWWKQALILVLCEC